MRKTNSSKGLGINRIFLATIFLMTGVMKLAFEKFGAAWNVQLIEAMIPFPSFFYWYVPVLEIIIGIMLAVGFYARLAAALVIPIMLVAIYVHLVVNNPLAFPAQPNMPIMPILIILMAIQTVRKGGGAWSKDLIAS